MRVQAPRALRCHLGQLVATSSGVPNGRGATTSRDGMHPGMTTMHAPNLTVPSCVLADRCRPGISPCLCRRTSKCAGGRSRSPRPRLCNHTPSGRHCAAHVAPRDRLLFAHDVDSAPCMHGVSPTGSLRRARLVHAGRMANSERRHVEAAWHGVACRKFATTKQAEMIDINFKQLTRIYPVGAATQSPPQSRWRGLLRPTSDRAGGYSSLLSLHCVRLLATNARTPTCAGGCHTGGPAHGLIEL